MSADALEDLFDRLEIFSHLAPEQRREIAAEFHPESVPRGDTLLRQGDAAEAMFIVVSGRFAVLLDRRSTPISEIGPGQPIGEIAFLSGGTRTATVVALRDSLVLRLDRERFDRLTANNPALWRLITVALALRVSDLNAARPVPPDPRPRTLALIRAGATPIPQRFITVLAETLAQPSQKRRVRGRRVQVVGPQSARELIASDGSYDTAEATAAFNDLERKSDFVVYVAGDALDEWSDKAIRQADIVLEVGVFGADATVNPLEARAAALLPASSRRLVLLHETRRAISGTKGWLAGRTVAMHHHVALDNREDFARLARFLKGTAIGLIACGGGALCTAQIGLFRAFVEFGVRFDIMGGTSGGSAYTAAFALGRAPDEIEAATHEMFVTNRAMRRLTWPRYSLVDHKHFDAELRRHYGGHDIEDLWIPFYAVSTNLSQNCLQRHSAGDLWSAVRASASIPVVLPPYYTSDGEMLVDGCLLDNVPIKTMHETKSGPNVVMSFEVPELERFDVAYDALPSRNALLAAAMNPFHRNALPAAPGLMTVLLRSLMANRQDFTRHMTEEDVLVIPPVPDDMGFLDWHRHGELVELAYRWAKSELERQGTAMHDWLDSVMMDAPEG
ncbi:MAG: cyclic nucleotide-binding and patatin-like phospholipase domain-containing protein [Hyphomicrobiaceae bacterium]